MKKLLLLLLFSVLFIGLAGCKKDKTDNFDAAAQAAKDDAQIQAYLKANNITAVKDPSGVYYEVQQQGTGANATSSSTVNVNYTGTLLSGSQFDTGNYTTGLGASANVIQGWKVGLTHINKGGRIRLFIPSALGYGHSGYATIPPDTVLIFLIDVISIQ